MPLVTSETAQYRPSAAAPDAPPATDLLTVEQLREQIRELYEAQREVERERDALRAAQASLLTERDRIRAAQETVLRRNELRLRTIFETEPDCVKVMTPEGALLEINEAGVEMFGADSIAQLKQYRLDDMIVPEHQAAFAEMHARVMNGERGLLEFEIIGLKGARRWLETHATSMLDAETGNTVVLSICRDITAQKQAMQALVRNQAIVRQISGALPLGFLVIDERRAQIVHVNQQFCDLFEVSELLGPIRRQEITVDDLLTRCMRHVQDAEALAGGCHIDTPLEARTVVDDEIVFKDGRILRRYSTQIRDEQDRYVSRFYMFEDITARRRAEEERARLESQLHQAMKMQSVGRLAGGVAHDFNNMLGVIIGHVEMAMQSVSEHDPLLDDLSAIHQAAQRSAGLTRQLLAFARQQAVTPRQMDLNATVAASLRMLERLISEDVRLEWQPAPQLWPLCMDPTQVDQILTNLCVNARDAIADTGTVTIATANCTLTETDCLTLPDARPGDYVRLTVQDDGCGIEPELLAQIFEPFFTTKRMGQGTGLGLASVYGTVKQNGGVIAVRSAPGKGTTFDIFLPRFRGAAEEPKPMPDAEQRPTGGETVLVVEDERAILVLVSHILKGRGYRVLSANSPTDALTIAASHAGSIDLLLTDVIMPEMNGRDLASAVQQRHPQCRALFMSGYTSDVIARHGVLDDGVAFVQKPFTIDALASRVRQTLDRAD